MKMLFRVLIFFSLSLLIEPLEAVTFLGPAAGSGVFTQQRPRRPGPRTRESEDEGIKPYEKVIPEGTKTDEGVFKVHQVKEKYYYEIPVTELGKDFLWVTTIAKTTLGVGYGGQSLGSRVVRWERHGDRILLRNISYEVVADASLPIHRAVEAANNETILMAFRILAEGPGQSAVIDVSPLFTTEVPEFSPRTRLQARGFDKQRSFIERIASYPSNIEAEATQTFTRPPQTPGAANRPPTPRGRFGGRGMRPGSATVLMHFSMVKLPEHPMKPRLYDDRVGYFTARQMDYGIDEHRAPERRYITRWRLEKKDPSAQISEPVKPIVYWIDPATPAKWVPWLKKGVEDWQKAFEAAGFRKAIIARLGPTPEEDPDWSPEDARYSVIRWLPSTIENASGPHIHDPRTGEILDADIQFYHNVQNLVRSWYFLQVGPLDPRAQKLPLPDDLMGRLLEYVVAHEVGHTLGFQHNMKASSTYPLDKVRDPQWVRKMGHTPSIMDYSRFNYVAQPEDGIPIEDLIPGIGPYDVFATRWGYKPIPEAATPDQEKKTLDDWIAVQNTTPWLRFSTPNSHGSDSGELTEAVGDADAVKATALGLKNLRRVAAMLLPAASEKGRNWDDLEELYGRMLGQWVREMNHVVAIVGGFHSQEKHPGQEGVIFQPMPGSRQALAVKFLNENAFQTPRFMIRKEILRRIEPAGVLGRIRNSQRAVLNALLNSNRFSRLVEQEALDGAAAYRPTALLADLRGGVWSELGQPKVHIDSFRRNLQEVYLEVFDNRLNQDSGTEEMRPFLRGELRTLSRSVEGALSRSADTETRYHLQNVRDRISRILDPRFVKPRPAASQRLRRAVNSGQDPAFDPERGCWPDYIIRP